MGVRREAQPDSRRPIPAFISNFLEIDLTDVPPALISSFMEMHEHQEAAAAIAALGALAQEHRLAAFRRLVQAGEAGLAAGAIADALGIPNSSLSFHLAQLARAGLIRSERRHRSLVYRADYETMNRLVGYLMENCCAGADCAPDLPCGESAAPAPERTSA